MSLFSDTTTTSSNAPWIAAQPYLKQVMGGAQQAYQAGHGFQPAPISDLYRPMSDQTQGALSGLWSAASQGNPLEQNAMGSLSGIMGGTNQQMGALSGILSGANPQMASLSGFAPGGAMANQYQDLYTQASNPYFQNALQNQVDLTANDVQRQFGSLGRTGSAADTGALVSQLGQLRTNALSNQWNQNVQNQLSIMQGESGSMLNAAQIGLGATQNAASTGLNAQLNAAQQAPQAYQASMLPYAYQAQVGQAYDAQNKAAAAAQLQRYQSAQMNPWNRASAYSGLVGGGSLNTASSTQVPSSPLGSIIGGALSGASMLPGSPLIGALAGGAVGGMQFV